MTQARRAKGRRDRAAWLLIAITLVMLLAGTLIFLGVRRQAELGRSPVSPASTSPTSTSSAPTSSPSASPDASTPTAQPENSAAAAALRACRAKVEAGDKVLATAKKGMQNWSDHIQAQTDANAGEITSEEMEDIFDRTMKAGDEDEKQYEAAVKSFEDREGTCREVRGASAQVARQLARCAERRRAQEPVLRAAEDGMQDWIEHLSDMRRSAQGKLHDPAQKWLKTWRAAPKNIGAYNEAVDKFSAPNC
jgi:hypothetical protein